jgi:hypothetical protein
MIASHPGSKNIPFCFVTQQAELMLAQTTVPADAALCGKASIALQIVDIQVTEGALLPLCTPAILSPSLFF